MKPAPKPYTRKSCQDADYFIQRTCYIKEILWRSLLDLRCQGGIKRDKRIGTNGLLQNSAVSCGLLRKSAVFCEKLGLRNAVILKKSETQQKSAKKLQKTAPFVPFSLSLLISLDLSLRCQGFLRGFTSKTLKGFTFVLFGLCCQAQGLLWCLRNGSTFPFKWSIQVEAVRSCVLKRPSYGRFGIAHHYKPSSHLNFRCQVLVQALVC